MRYTRAQADDLAKALHALPAAQKERTLTKQQLVAFLTPQIIGLQERGHTLAAIAGLLTAGGLPITHATLRTYLSRSKTRGRRRRRKARNSRGGGLANRRGASVLVN
jgi:hypothetical protein